MGSLPDFCGSKTITVEVYINEDTIGYHDIVFGQTFCANIGNILDYKNMIVVCGDLSIPMPK